MVPPRRSDFDLRHILLTISDPYDQEELISLIPEGATLVAVENTYQLPRSVPMPALRRFRKPCGRFKPRWPQTLRFSPLFGSATFENR